MCITDGCKKRKYPGKDMCKSHYYQHGLTQTDKKDEDGKSLLICPKCVTFMPKDGFINKLGKVSKNCSACLEHSREVEKNRPKRDQSAYYKKYEQRPEVKAMRKKYKEDNPEIATKGWMDYRARQFENNKEEYLAKNAKNMIKWKAKNPEKVAIAKKKKNANPHYKLQYYKRRAEEDGREWSITDEEALDMFHDKCHFCDSIEATINGIDRVNNSLGYTTDNTVACCSMCNYMKNTLDIVTFLKRCIHIASYNELLTEQFYSEAFADFTVTSFASYKKRAEKKNIEFTMTEDTYNKLIDEPCYMCGKDNCKNGIDRIDNSKGYCDGNITACCYCCNVMKKNFELQDVLNKCKSIAEKFDDKVDDMIIDKKSGLLCSSKNKKKTNRQEKKEAKYEATRQQMMNPEYRLKHAKELAAKHKAKKTEDTGKTGGKIKKTKDTEK